MASALKSPDNKPQRAEPSVSPRGGVNPHSLPEPPPATAPSVLGSPSHAHTFLPTELRAPSAPGESPHPQGAGGARPRQQHLANLWPIPPAAAAAGRARTQARRVSFCKCATALLAPARLRVPPRTQQPRCSRTEPTHRAAAIAHQAACLRVLAGLSPGWTLPRGPLPHRGRRGAAGVGEPGLTLPRPHPRDGRRGRPKGVLTAPWSSNSTGMGRGRGFLILKTLGAAQREPQEPAPTHA